MVPIGDWVAGLIGLWGGGIAIRSWSCTYGTVNHEYSTRHMGQSVDRHNAEYYNKCFHWRLSY